MNELKIMTVEGQLVTDSREVAEMVDKNHGHLMRDIRGYVEVLLKNPKLDYEDFFIESTYKAGDTNRFYDCYLLTKKGCDMVANKMTGEKGVLFTAVYIANFYEMEKSLEQSQFQLPMTYKEAMLQLIEKEEEKEQLLLENKTLSAEMAIQAPKADYADKVLSSVSTMNITQIAKEFGMSGQAMNKLLKGLKIQFYSGGQWVLQSPHDKYDYVDTETHAFTNSKGEPDSNRRTKWTESGKRFIHDKLKEAGILPVNQRNGHFNFE